VSAAPPPIQTIGLEKTYQGVVPYQALRGINLTIEAGEMVALVGASGSGKSTLMNILGCLDRPTAGEYRLAGRSIAAYDDDELARMRNRHIGFVFQSFNLLPRYSALQNAALPLIYADAPRHEREVRAREALVRVGLGDRLNNRPKELSGGQCQRVAIARAIVNRPAILMADEPTGALDSRTAREVIGIMQALNDAGMTVVVVTHDAEVAACCKRRVRLHDGQIIEDVPLVQVRGA
jgi:putative ABC transport system ATP-binding protein